MKASMALVFVPLLIGCSGLNVQWAVSATYNTPAVTVTRMTPGIKPAEEEERKVVP